MDHHMRFHILAPLLALACLSSTAQAQIIKCIKPDGSMELSDRPCAKGTNSHVSVGPMNSSDGAHYQALARQQRVQEQIDDAKAAAYTRTVRAQRQQEADTKAHQEFREKLLEAQAKADKDARRAARRQAAAVQAAQAAQEAAQSTPQRITGCNTHGCRDSSGRYYDHANNNRYWSNGQMCRERNGRMQC